MKRVRNKSGATRSGSALLLKFFEAEARFPESAREVPSVPVEYVAQQVQVLAGAWAEYDWQARQSSGMGARSGRRTGSGRTPRRTRTG